MMQWDLIVFSWKVWICSGIQKVGDNLQILTHDRHLERRFSLKSPRVFVNYVAVHELR